MAYSIHHKNGFTLMELVMIITLISIISVVAVAKWPSNMDEEAAVREFKRAVRYGQHIAMTREFVDGATAWGIMVNSHAYTIERRGSSEQAGSEFITRQLLGNGNITLTGPAELLFNGLGEPIASDGSPLTTTQSYTIAGSSILSVCPQSGYIREGNCP